jgi:hypothetical protein
MFDHRGSLEPGAPPIYPASMSDPHLTRLRLQLIVEQTVQAGDEDLPELAHAVDTLISALDEGGPAHGLVERLRSIWAGIEIINAVCLDERRAPSRAERDQLHEDVESLREAALAGLAHLA